MDENTSASIEWFFSALEPVARVYDDPAFGYLIHNGPDGVALITSQLALQPLPSDGPDIIVEAGSHYGFSGRLKTLGVTPRELISMLLDGYLPAPDRTWKLSREGGFLASTGINRVNPRSSEVDPQQQIYELVGHGLSINRWHNSEEDDWLLRAAPKPYSSLNDVIRELRLPFGHTQFHMIATPPLLVDATSCVKGEVAELKLRRSKHLPVDRVKLGIVVSDRDGVKQRSQIAGDRFTWTVSEQSESVLVGTTEVPVPKASVVHCLAVHDQHCLHHFWVDDPDASQNPRRTIYEIFDPKFSKAFENITQSPKRGQTDAQENAVSALLWVLGFAPVQLGKSPYAPDVIGISVDGHLVVVECTTSHLQVKENKPQQLIDRTNEIRAALERLNAGSSICIPVLVTSKRRTEIEDDVAECERKGIVVYTFEDVEPIIGRTITRPQSDVRFAEMKQRLDDALQRIQHEKRKQREMESDVEKLKKSFKA